MIVVCTSPAHGASYTIHCARFPNISRNVVVMFASSTAQVHSTTCSIASGVHWYIPYSRKFSRDPIFAVFADDRRTTKIIKGLANTRMRNYNGCGYTSLLERSPSLKRSEQLIYFTPVQCVCCWASSTETLLQGVWRYSEASRPSIARYPIVLVLVGHTKGL